MESGSKLLKVVSIIMIVYGAIIAVLGLITTLGGGALMGADVADADEAMAVGSFAAMLGVVFLFSGIIEIVTGVIGLKASKDNGKHKAAFVIGIISVISAGYSLITALGGDGGSILGSVVGLILPALYLYGVYQTRQGA